MEYGILLLPKEKDYELIDNSLNYKSTSPFLLKDKRLAIAQWTLPLIYKYALNLLKNSQNPFSISKIILFINPEHYTCWNIRRMEIEKNENFDFIKEFQYTNLIQTKYPKCEVIWNYKKWMMKKMKKVTNEFIEKELDHCSKCSEIYPRNYYAWAYRVFLLNNFKNDDILNMEFKKMMEWIPRHVSDHSAIHHMTLVLDDLNNNDLFMEQMYFSQYLIINFPGHESLWIYRRFLFKKLKIDENIKCEYSDEHYKYLLPTIENETLFCNQCGNDTEMERYEDQKKYSKSYLSYILSENTTKK